MKTIDLQNPRKTDLSPCSKTVLALAWKYMRIRIATIHAFPSDAIGVSWVKGSYRQACMEKEVDTRFLRFEYDMMNHQYITSLVRFRTCL